MGDVFDIFVDVGDLVNEFNYKLNMMIEDGIGKFVVWYWEYFRV